MKAIGLTIAGAALAALAGCASPPPPAPRPAPARPAPPPPAPAPEPAQDWRDTPLTPGAWTYQSGAAGPEALYGPAGAPAFAVRCDSLRRQVTLSREGVVAPGPLTIRTSAGARALAGPVASLPASDPFLDAIVFSRGRFTVEMSDAPALVVPAWPEPARVVEDCRG